MNYGNIEGDKKFIEDWKKEIGGILDGKKSEIRMPDEFYTIQCLLDGCTDRDEKSTNRRNCNKKRKNLVANIAMTLYYWRGKGFKRDDEEI